MKIILWTKWKAVNHYKRMIKWAKLQPGQNVPCTSIMIRDIDACWYSNDCSYCHKYWEISDKCPLKYDGNYCSQHSCYKGLWLKMYEAKTWTEWIFYAEKILIYIKKHG